MLRRSAIGVVPMYRAKHVVLGLGNTRVRQPDHVHPRTVVPRPLRPLRVRSETSLDQEPRKKKSFKELMKAYGPTAFVVHTSVYLMTLSSLYVGVSTGVIATGELVDFLQLHIDKLGWHVTDESSSSNVGGNFAAAWLLAKLTEPIRIPITVFLTPKAAKFVNAWGAKAMSRAKTKIQEKMPH